MENPNVNDLKNLRIISLGAGNWKAVLSIIVEILSIFSKTRTVTFDGKEKEVGRECFFRSCILLPHK